MPEVCAVTVTYGDRYPRLASPTVIRALAAAASHVVVVDNGSLAPSRLAMENDFDQDPRVTVVHLGGNLGSAVGIAQGMQRAAALFVLDAVDRGQQPVKGVDVHRHGISSSRASGPGASVSRSAAVGTPSETRVAAALRLVRSPGSASAR